MKVRLITFYLSVMSVVSAEAIEVYVPISNYIINNKNSESIAIDADNYNFTAIYQKSSNKFKDLYIPFRVVSRDSSVSSYNIELYDSTHRCQQQEKLIEVNVATKLDSNDIVQDSIDSEFKQQSSTEKWTQHQLQLVFSTTEQQNTQQTCYGRVTLFVSANV